MAFFNKINGILTSKCIPLTYAGFDMSAELAI